MLISDAYIGQIVTTAQLRSDITVTTRIGHILALGINHMHETIAVVKWSDPTSFAPYGTEDDPIPVHFSNIWPLDSEVMAKTIAKIKWNRISAEHYK